MEDKKDRDGHVDADVVQGKADVLRARDAVKAAMNGTAGKKKVEKVEVRPVRAVKVEGKAKDAAGAEAVKKADAQAEDSTENGGGGGIPRLNLGEKILAEQRQASAKKRQKSHRGASDRTSYPARDTVGEIIREAKGESTEVSEEVGVKEAVAETGRSIMIDDDYLNDSQRRLVAEIVSRDILALCG